MASLKVLLTTENLTSFSVMAMRGTSLIIKFLFSLFLAKFLGFQALGFYGLIFASSIVSRVILGLGLMYSISRNAITDELSKVCSSLKYYLSYISCVYFTLSVFVIIGGYLSGYLTVSVLVVLILYSEHLSNDSYALLLNLSRPFVANLLHFIRTAFWMICFMIISYFNPPLRVLEVVLIAWLIGNIIAFFGTLYAVKNWPWGSSKKEIALRRWIQESFLLSKTFYFTDCIKTIATYWNHFFITLLLGIQLTGVFVYFMQLASAISNLIQTGVIQLARPTLVKAFKNKEDSFEIIHKNTLIRASLITVLLCIVCGFVFFHLTIFLEKPLALEWIDILYPILFLIVIGIICEVNAVVFYSAHRDDMLLKQATLSIVMTIILNAALVPIYALWGAVIASIITGIAILLYQWHLLKDIKASDT